MSENIWTAASTASEDNRWRVVGETQKKLIGDGVHPAEVGGRETAKMLDALTL